MEFADDPLPLPTTSRNRIPRSRATSLARSSKSNSRASSVGSTRSTRRSARMDTISHDSEGLEGEEIVMLDTRDTERRGTRHIISLDGDNDDEISWTVDEPQPGPSGLPARDTAPTDNESGPGPSSTAQLVANAEPGPSTTANLTRVLRMAELEQPRLREQEEISMASTSSSKRPRSTPGEDEDDGTFGPGEGEDSSTSRRTRRRLETTIGESSSSVAWKGEVPSDVGMRVDPPPARYPFEHANARPSGSGAGSSSLAGPSQETQATRIDEEEPVTDPPPTQLTPDATASGSGSGSLDSSSLSQSFAEGDGGSSSIVEGISASRPGSSTTAGGSSSTVSSAPDDTNSSSNAPDPANPPPVSPTKPESSTESQPDSLSSYTCPICFYPPTNATLTPCGHICCGECLFAAIKTTLKRNEHLLPPRIGGGFRDPTFGGDFNFGFGGFGGGPMGDHLAMVTRGGSAGRGRGRGGRGGGAGRGRGQVDEEDPSVARCPVCRAPIPGWDGRGGGVIGLKVRTVFGV